VKDVDEFVDDLVDGEVELAVGARQRDLGQWASRERCAWKGEVRGPPSAEQSNQPRITEGGVYVRR
jgi:hypothetical protein